MIYSYELCGRPKIIWFVRPRCQVVCSNMKRLTQIIDSQSIVKTVICDGWFTLTTTGQTIANPGSWNVVQLSAVDDMLRRVNITLNNVQGERISVNNLTVTGCYDPTGRPTVRLSLSFSLVLRLEESLGIRPTLSRLIFGLSLSLQCFHLR